MASKYPPISAKCPHMLHGGDYNPEQWVRTPEVWDEDIRLMKEAGVNTATVGVFSWVSLEPEEGRFDFTWLDIIMEKFARNDIFAVLATPSGARPAWLSRKYPEVMRVRGDRGRNLHGVRENHCFTSPIYREKTRIINTKLAERYKGHPALILWHISNEYHGECHCNLCQEAFRVFLRKKYKNDLDALNHAWWTAFWSHTYTDWQQIESPSSIGENSIHGLTLDWRRFVTHQTIDFMCHEIRAVRQVTPDIPVTTNMHGSVIHLDYYKFVPHMDVISWDTYPTWHSPRGDAEVASEVAFIYEMCRAMKGGRPFMLMESTPSTVNWQPACKLKRPGMHRLSSLQAVAHGSDTVQYFQWRMSRGSCEKFHGAVVDHSGRSDTRVFKDVAALGADLAKLDAIVGATTQAPAAIIFDVENAWSIDVMQALGKDLRKYKETVISHYRSFWKMGIAVDIIDQSYDISGYKLVAAPMLYMLRPGFPERVENFVRAGGTFVTTYWSGLVDENDLTFLGGFPGGGLRKVLGIWNEETDAIHPSESNSVIISGCNCGLKGPYKAQDIFALIHAEGAKVHATFGSDFHAGRPALTCNTYGKGRAWYIASRNEQAFQDDFYGRLAAELALERAVECDLPAGVSAACRSDGINEFLFLMNFTGSSCSVNLGAQRYRSLLTGADAGGIIAIEPYEVKVFARR
ncbi:MAG TPA: beta-galactosidase [Sedimentisphaerales bacterium]|nr:beta-galactosidase [Sedimentisphaerales bacterium]